MKKLLLIVGVVVAASFARADIIPSYISATPDNGNTIWTYNVNVTAEQNATSGDYFTIYDFGDFTPGTNVQPAGWTFSFALVGVTPDQTLPPDSPSIYNLTWTYNGPTIIGASADGQNIGPFSVTIPGVSTLEPGTGYFAAQGTLASGPNAGSKVNNVGVVPIPVPIPEPSTLALIAGTAGLGMVGRALARRRRL